MSTTDFFRVAILATGLSFIAAMGPVSASADQGSTRTCEAACGTAANTMMGQTRTTNTSTRDDHGSRSESLTVPAYTPDQVNDFHKKCRANCNKK